MDALFSEIECTQLRGQVDIWDAIAEAEAEEAQVELVDDGALFPVYLTGSPVDGALFGLTL
ncbi:hypothetical protein ACIRPH_29995 [Nocardiopsis sp. NPDC101807]|uniref:hypothetical protein n=1 Tax=Nocardiopsis sp. NPDC101807 TaxID=3364339 RepID=UPI0038217992